MSLIGFGVGAGAIDSFRGVGQRGADARGSVDCGPVLLALQRQLLWTVALVACALLARHQHTVAKESRPRASRIPNVDIVFAASR